MTNFNKISANIEENYYQILDVPNTASLSEIRQAYEGKLEEAHLEAFAAYSLLPEEESEEKLLYFSHAYITLANPIARAKYDDELNQNNIPAKKKSDLAERNLKKSKESTTKVSKKNKSEKKDNVAKKEAQVIAGQTLKERQDYYLKLSAKNEHSADSIEEYYNTIKTGGSKITYNGAVLQQIRKMKSISISELAQITCIRGAYLKAIEEEDFSKFSSEIYLKGYLLCYAESMHLPTEKVLDDYIKVYKNSARSENG
ncbi:MAG: hypothetical protein CL935_04245 [Deltaproteobacteria bacterium]|nr:hypothetical protein [Deltaproteobacteria bacterium]